MVRRHELSDAQWQKIEPLLPANGKPGGQWADHRTVINGVLYRPVPVCPGRTCPSGTALGKPSTSDTAAGQRTAPGGRSWASYRSRRMPPIPTGHWPRRQRRRARRAGANGR
ncbi:transposase [Streptantibioticus rubrisoli]|uniref:transposase n=1 Tax=Streptantibioticus rubrisoli TaxID=1387313 RepID=UPI0035573D3E